LGLELRKGARPTFCLIGSIVLLACLTRPVLAEDTCGSLPVFDHSKTETSGNVVLNFLKGLLGQGEARGSFTSTPEDVLHLYPNPDTLLPRITVFVLECKLVLQDTTLSPAQKRDEILRIYNIVFLQRNGLERHGTWGRYAALVSAVPVTVSDVQGGRLAVSQRPTIEEQIRAKEAWRATWFHEALDGPPPANSAGNYHVIVASPCGEEAAQQAVNSYSTKYPDIYFELWRTVGKCYFAVTAGTGLKQDEARKLLAIVKQRGMDGYLWHW
jgi:hypothetical protein